LRDGRKSLAPHANVLWASTKTHHRTGQKLTVNRLAAIAINIAKRRANSGVSLYRCNQTTNQSGPIMQKSLLWRIATIGFLVVCLFIPLALVQGVVAERRFLQQGVEQTIAASSSGPQELAGPVLVVPYSLNELIVSKDEKGKETRRWVLRHERVAFAPTSLSYDAMVDVEEKHKGLYKALVYHTRGAVKASYAVPKMFGLNLDLNAAYRRMEIGDAYIAVGLSDPRGLRGTPEVTLNREPLTVQNNTYWGVLGNGFHASAGRLDGSAPASLDLAMQLNFSGTRSLAIAPLGETMIVNMAASWPHPNFGGRFLPTSHKQTPSGFTATWEISQLASKNAEVALTRRPEKMQQETFNVTFIEPVNIYQQAERAVKYGLLFIVLTFGAFFLMETLKNLRIHPLQYGLVGLALAIFFLLLVSLSEHIAFVHAYITAAAACVALITYYLAHVLGGWRRGMMFGMKLIVLFATLYGLLLSEDNALMLGAILLFAALAAVMTITRRVNWYEFGRAK
jgi:inner membrane protein